MINPMKQRRGTLRERERERKRESFNGTRRRPKAETGHCAISAESDIIADKKTSLNQ